MNTTEDLIKAWKNASSELKHTLICEGMEEYDGSYKLTLHHCNACDFKECERNGFGTSRYFEWCVVCRKEFCAKCYPTLCTMSCDEIENFHCKSC